MPYCRNCGAELAENAQFCPKCGTPVSLRNVEKAKPAPKRGMGLSPWALTGIAILALIILVVVFSSLFLGGVLPFGGKVGSGNVQTRVENISGFTAVDVGSGFKVQITQASSYSVRITTDDNILDSVRVSKTGNTLTIGLPTGSFQTTTLKADITMPDLRELTFSGGVNATATGFVISHDFTARLSGGSKLSMQGEANNLVVSCSGGSSINFSDFAVQNADVEMSGGSQGTINVRGTLNANLSGGSRLFYSGNPKLGNINTSGGSTVAPAVFG